MNKRSFFVFNHQNKADAFIRALTTRGWTLTRRPDEARFILADVDIPPRYKVLKEYHSRGAAIFLYPHAARPNLFWDFPGVEFSGFVAACFVAAEGHIDIMRAYGNPYDLHAVGWHLSPIQPFKPRTEVKRILFAPIHPNGNGFLSRMDMDINQQTFRKLIALINEGVSLTVRYLHDIRKNGLWRAGGVDYVEGKPDQSYRQIDEADLVVSHQTFAYLAVARGTPTLMMGEWHAPRWGGSEEKLERARSWERYKHLLMYPLDILAEEGTEALIEKTIRSDCTIADWRERLIGKPFNGEYFVAVLESYL